MSYPIIFTSQADSDLAVAHLKYKQIKAELAERFLAAVQICLEKISDNPAMYAILEDNIRAAVLRKFPYVIYFRLEADTAHVLGVIHGRRSDRAWKYRSF
jgi:plasmid stabilization system protein ParE